VTRKAQTGWRILKLDYEREGLDCLEFHPWIFNFHSISTTILDTHMILSAPPSMVAIEE
jgi:hypothetical protein